MDPVFWSFASVCVAALTLWWTARTTNKQRKIDAIARQMEECNSVMVFHGNIVLECEKLNYDLQMTLSKIPQGLGLEEENYRYIGPYLHRILNLSRLVFVYLQKHDGLAKIKEIKELITENDTSVVVMSCYEMGFDSALIDACIGVVEKCQIMRDKCYDMQRELQKPTFHKVLKPFRKIFFAVFKHFRRAK